VGKYRIKLRALLDPDEVRAVLDRLCLKYGFCLPPNEIERLVQSPPPDIDEFVEAVFLAEGYGFTKSDPLCQKAREVVAQAFIDHYAKNPE
jgi:hypothetical protein